MMKKLPIRGECFQSTQHHILTTDRKLESAGNIIMGQPCYYTPLYVIKKAVGKRGLA